MGPILSIIVVNFNGIQDTLELLASIEKFLDLEYVEVIVVDNGSLNNESIAIAKYYPWSKTIRSEVNLGFAGGNNLGIQASIGKYVMLLNNDTLLKDNSLMKLPDAFNADSTIGVVYQRYFLIIRLVIYSMQATLPCPGLPYGTKLLG